MNYEQAKELLTSQGKFYINLGLERIQSILKLIGNPQEKIKIIHVTLQVQTEKVQYLLS